MGSLQQSILGVFCIATAFLLGQYMRNHPSPESLEQQRLEKAAAVPDPSFGFGSSSSAVAKNADAEPERRLPSPSEGFGLNVETSGPSVQVDLLAEQAKPPGREIDIPDFSKLAASFKNTPLELPETGPPPNRRTPIVDKGSFYIRPTTDLARTNDSSRDDQAATEPIGQPAFAGSRPEAVPPPQPMEAYKMEDWSTSFKREDFQPNLITKETSRRRSSDTNLTSEKSRLSLAPPEPDGSFLMPEVPSLDVVMPADIRSASATSVNQTASHTNNVKESRHVHSYYDGVKSDSDFERDDFRQSSDANAQRIPFGLNDQGKRELTKIQLRQKPSVNLQTNRFAQHTTRQGDTLQSLSTRYYGRPDFYLDIYLANQQLLRSPAVIPAGIQLQIPKYE